MAEGISEDPLSARLYTPEGTPWLSDLKVLYNPRLCAYISGTQHEVINMFNLNFFDAGKDGLKIVDLPYLAEYSPKLIFMYIAIRWTFQRTKFILGGIRA